MTKKRCTPEHAAGLYRGLEAKVADVDNPKTFNASIESLVKAVDENQDAVVYGANKGAMGKDFNLKIRKALADSKKSIDEIRENAKGFILPDASQRFGNTFYNQVAREMRSFFEEFEIEGEIRKIQIGEGAKNLTKEYQRFVVPKMNDLIDEIHSIASYHAYGRNPELVSEYTEALKPYGLKPGQVTDAIAWLQWIKEGTFMQQAGLMGKALNRLSYHQVNFNLQWAFFNLVDLTRPTGHFLAKALTSRDGAQRFARGVKKAFSNRQDLENVILPFEFTDVSKGPKGLMKRLDPFRASTRLQQRLTWYLDIEFGGDGFEGLRNVTFDREPWDVPALAFASKFGTDGERAALGLGRFLFAEAHYNWDNIKNVLKIPLGKADAQKLSAYTIDQSIRGLMFGPMATPLAFALALMDDDEKNEFYRMGLANNAVNSLFNAAGLDNSHVEMARVLSIADHPTGVLLGARLSSITSIFNQVGRGLKEPDSAESIVRLTPVLSLLANPYGAGPVAGASRIFGNQQLQDAVKIFLEEDGDEQVTLAKEQLFGSKAVRKD